MGSGVSAFAWLSCATLALVACGGDLAIGGVPGDGGTGSDSVTPGNSTLLADGAPASNGTPRPIVLAQNSVDQLDILFDIDNSASMGDKQVLLEQAVPDLISRLVNPNCVNPSDGTLAGSSTDGSCAAYAGSVIEFKPVHDMHLGIVSSSLGSRGGDLCMPAQVTNNGGAFADGNPAVNSHADDMGHLLTRAGVPSTTNPNQVLEREGTLADVGGQGFLDWFPRLTLTPPDSNDPTASVAPVLAPVATALTMVGTGGANFTPGTLEGDFSALVAGVHAFGCGIESQLESWYRFLIQPDPYASIAPASTAPFRSGQWVGYDSVIIRERHDFLRPNSLVAIIVMSDENDSEIDTRSFSGIAANWMVSTFQPPHGTTPCATNPAAAGCQSCASLSAGAQAADPACATPYTAQTDWGFNPNLRHVHMQEKYGIVPQYPIQRYYLGLTSPLVPDRNHEYPMGASSYRGGTVGDPADLNCRNPLFAPPNADGSTTLPTGADMSPTTLCNTAHPASGSSRRQGQVIFAHIGGVPHQLLQAAPGVVDAISGQTECPAGTPQADCPQKDTLGLADWVKILGAGAASATATSPPSYDYTGIDPHMVEAYAPRVAGNLPTGVTTPVPLYAPTPAGGFAGGDPINGGDWVTNNSTAGAVPGAVPAPVHRNLYVDREYACIFPLVNSATGASTPRDCSNSSVNAMGQWDDFLDQEACDCSTTKLSTTTPSAIPSVCGQCTAATCKVGTDYNLQTYAKAYPTIREIELVHLMGQQGVLSSICPIHTSETVPGDPVFGYRPAVNSIINRLKSALTTACLPEKLAPTAGSCVNDAVKTDQCVQCLVVATLPPHDDGMRCEYIALGLTTPSAQTLANYEVSQGDSGLSGRTICQVAQIPYGGPNVSCDTSTTPGWCYVQYTEGSSVMGAFACIAQNQPQSIVFTPGFPPAGSTVSLLCPGLP